MARIAFLGAGSFIFTRNLVRDILTFERMEDAELVLMDIDAERLGYIRKAVKMIVDKGKYPAKVIATTSRREALKGADAVITTVLQGGMKIWRHDIEIPKKHGIDTVVGDTRGPSGIFRALRTVPLMLDICRDIERYAPNAILLNYTNPMAMLCHAMQRETSVRVTGLCHSVQGTAEMLAGWIGAPMDEITYVCAGINHLAWYLEFKRNGVDAYPAIRKAITSDGELFEKEAVRNEMFLNLGLYVTESSYHSSEYNWWFRKREDLREKYARFPYGAMIAAYKKREPVWRETIKEWIRKREISLERGKEYAAYIINAWLGGDAFEFNGNVPNTGIITNLPEGACVEVPVIANKRGFNAIHVGALPPQVAILNKVSVDVEMMAVDAAIAGDPRKVFHACAYDPLTAATLSLSEIRAMVKEMLKFNFDKGQLPQFKSIRF